MTEYAIVEIADKEYIAIDTDERDPDDFGVVKGFVIIDTANAWIPGSITDLRRSLQDRAIDMWKEQNNN